MLPGDDKYKRPIGVLFSVGEERQITAQLKLKRGNLLDSNVVSIANDELVNIVDGGSLHGISEAGMVSVLDCVNGGILGSTSWADFLIYHGDVSFRYALFGEQHITIDQECVRRIQFTLEGADSSVFMQDKIERFGHLYNPDKAILDAIELKRPKHLKGEFVRGKAMVSYFTGDWDFLPRSETVLGMVHVGRMMQVDFFGRRMEDTPRITVDFDDDPTTLGGAWEKMREIRQFFAWMMGYVPAWKDVVVFTSRLNEDGFLADPDAGLEVFGPNEWTEVPKGARECGTLIDASRHPDHFMEVMQKWLKRNSDGRRKSANTRFSGCLPGIASRVIEDRILSAANTFDLLPSEDKPEFDPLPAKIEEVLKDASRKIKNCKDAGPQREDILNALGRIRKNKRLRSIVEYRAEVVLDYFGRDRLKNLENLIRLSVTCRNYYTHGPDDLSSDDIDYADLGIVLFLTETLEFIYGVSELLICGWDPARSLRAEFHPLGGYVSSYDTRCSIALGMQ